MVLSPCYTILHTSKFPQTMVLSPYYTNLKLWSSHHSVWFSHHTIPFCLPANFLINGIYYFPTNIAYLTLVLPFQGSLNVKFSTGSSWKLYLHKALVSPQVLQNHFGHPACQSLAHWISILSTNVTSSTYSPRQLISLWNQYEHS